MLKICEEFVFCSFTRVFEDLELVDLIVLEFLSPPDQMAESLFSERRLIMLKTCIPAVSSRPLLERSRVKADSLS